MFGISINQLFFLIGVSKSTASNASIIMACIPIITLVIATMLKHEKLTVIKLAGILIAFMGASYVVGFADLEFKTYLVGNIFFLINAVSFALYLVLVKPMLKIYRTFTVITYVAIFGCLQVIPFSISKLTFSSLRIISNLRHLSKGSQNPPPLSCLQKGHSAQVSTIIIFLIFFLKLISLCSSFFCFLNSLWHWAQRGVNPVQAGSRTDISLPHLQMITYFTLRTIQRPAILPCFSVQPFQFPLSHAQDDPYNIHAIWSMPLLKQSHNFLRKNGRPY